EWTDLPLHCVNAFTLLKFTLVAHVLLWFFFDFLLTHYPWGQRFCGVPGAAWLVLVMLVVQVQVCFWTVSGFYDGVAVLFLVLMVGCYKRRQWPRVLLFFALAVFVHYRSLWFFPLAGIAVVQLGRALWVWCVARCGRHPVRGTHSVVVPGAPRAAAAVGWRQSVLVLGSVMLLAVAGVFFLLAYPN